MQFRDKDIESAVLFAGAPTGKGRTSCRVDAGLVGLVYVVISGAGPLAAVITGVRAARCLGVDPVAQQTDSRRWLDMERALGRELEWAAGPQDWREDASHSNQTRKMNESGEL